MKRKNERGLIPVFMVFALMWVTGVFVGGITATRHNIIEENNKKIADQDLKVAVSAERHRWEEAMANCSCEEKPAFEGRRK